MEHAFTRLACTHCGQTIDVPLYCGDRFCPVCSVSRKMRIRHRLTWLINCAPRDPRNRFFHLTLTISSEKDLAQMIRNLLKAFRRLRQRAYWKQHVDGGAAVIEVTGHPGAWHAHIHAILSCRWMKWDRLQSLWHSVSRGSGVYITHIPITTAVGYLTKYLSKPEAPDVVSTEISDSLRGIRMFAPFGSWHKINLTYIKPISPCRDCGGVHWQNEDIMQGRFPEKHFREFDISPNIPRNSSPPSH